MKKFFLFVLAFCSMSVFAQTNLFDASQASVISTWGAGDVNPTASWDAVSGTLSVELNAVQPGWQWGNQVAFGHTVDFATTKFYQVTMTIAASENCGGVTIKIDDNTGMIFEDQSINLVANTPFNYVSQVTSGAAGNHKIVFDFGYGVQGTQITISNIVIKEAPAPEIDLCDGSFVATSTQQKANLGADGNLGTRWESKSADGDDVKWQMNLATPATFNRVKIVWEGAYGKSFNINAGNDCDNLATIASIENQTLAGFPYTQIIELATPVTASHIQFEGIQRGTGYGYSFYEFEVYEAVTSVLSDLTFSAAATICQVNQNVVLTATPKDQYGVAMAETVTYTVTPAAAGHITAGVYTADAAGLATITATCGGFNKEVTIFNYAGENVALNKTATANGGYNDVARVNDGNDGTEFQADPSNGTSELNVTCGFTIDLGAVYNLGLVTIHFEGACSDAYTLETSLDNANWATAHTFAGTLGISNHTDYLYGAGLENANAVRYLKFTSTKNSTQWGMKIYEFKAFGTPVDYSRALTVDDYATICLPNAATLYGATAYSVASTNANEITIAPVVGNLVAGTPYIVKATAPTMAANFSGEAVLAPVAANGLVGNLSETPIVLNAASNAYILSENEFHLIAGEATATVGQYRAYLQGNLGSAPIRIIEVTDVATSFENTDANENVVKYIENGQLIIVKGGVRYNALGQVVK